MSLHGAWDAEGNDEITVDLSDAAIAALRLRAARSGRSFDDEVAAILDDAARAVPESPARG